jgi:hypothetical protein
VDSYYAPKLQSNRWNFEYRRFTLDTRSPWFLVVYAVNAGNISDSVYGVKTTAILLRAGDF